MAAIKKKLVPFNLDEAKRGATVKTSHNRPAMIITFDNPEPAPILGYYPMFNNNLENGYNIGKWNADGKPEDEIGSTQPELRLEVDDIDFFPAPKDTIDFVMLYKSACERADIAEKKLAEVTKQRDDYSHDLMQSERGRDDLYGKYQALSEKVGALVYARNEWLKAIKSIGK